MNTVDVVFEGKSLVPSAVDMPNWTNGAGQADCGEPPPATTEEHRRLWDEVARELESTAPYFPTLDEAMKALRG